MDVAASIVRQADQSLWGAGINKLVPAFDNTTRTL